MNAENHGLIDNFFGRHTTLTDDVKNYLHENFTPIAFKARDFIVEAGAIDNYFYLVLSGVQAIYIINGKGEKVILGFSYHGSPSGAFDSFITQKPSAMFLEALTDSQLLRISRDRFEALFERFPEFYQWRSAFIESILFGRLSRETEMLTFTARERFDAFMKRCPDELLQIPQKYLASYLNMQPETFSRLRAERN